MPQQYSVDTIDKLTSLNAFGSLKDYTESAGNLGVNVNENSLTLNGACETYIEDNKVATIYMRQLKQPNYEKTTDSFRIFINSGNKSNIAKVDSGVTFTPLRGSLEMSNSVSLTTVQEPTKVTFQLVPEHAIYFNDDPAIVIEFPMATQI